MELVPIDKKTRMELFPIDKKTRMELFLIDKKTRMELFPIDKKTRMELFPIDKKTKKGVISHRQEDRIVTSKKQECTVCSLSIKMISLALERTNLETELNLVQMYKLAHPTETRIQIYL